MSAPVVSINVLFCVLSATTAGVRLHRTYQKAKTFQVHDYMLMLALFCGIAEATLQCVETRYGLGQAFTGIPADDVMLYYQLLIGLFVAYLACNMFVKLSLLSFYRLLSRDHKYFWVICTMAAAAILFGVGSLTAFIFRCVPFAKQWNPEVPGQCINFEAYLYANAGIMIGFDIILYVLPILIVREVQLSRAKAAAMNVLFAMGFIVVLASCFRLWYLHSWLTSPDNGQYYLGVLLIWCTVENHLAIIIICLPAVKSVFVAVAPSLGSVPSSIWSNVRGGGKRRSGLPEYNSHAVHQTSSCQDPDTPRIDKRKTSWFSYNSTANSSHKSKGSLSTFVGTPRLGRKESVGDENIELRKQPSISMTEADSMRRPSEPDGRSWFAENTSMSRMETDKDMV